MGKLNKMNKLMRNLIII